jgi:hypothetical protein
MRKTISVVGFLVAFVAIFLVINTLHFRFFPVRVVLYDSMLDLALTAIVMAAFGFIFLRSRSALTGSEQVLTATVAILCCALYAVVVPTVIDRSLSVYILEKLNQRGDHIAESAFEDILRTEFFREYQLVNIRLTEQLNSGTITIENGCVNLTPWGKTIVAFTSFYRANILPKQREIMGQYNDSLTSPFRDATPLVPYQCKN